jgi:hypothetical protein
MPCVSQLLALPTGFDTGAHRNPTVQTITVRSYKVVRAWTLTLDAGFDLRPFLYPSRFLWQFRRIDELAASLPDKTKKELKESAGSKKPA